MRFIPLPFSNVGQQGVTIQAPAVAMGFDGLVPAIDAVQTEVLLPSFFVDAAAVEAQVKREVRAR